MEVTDSGYFWTNTVSVTVPDDGHTYGIVLMLRQSAYRTGSQYADWGDMSASRNGQSFVSIYKYDGTTTYTYDAGCDSATEYARYEASILYLYDAMPGTYNVTLSNVLFTTHYNWYLVKDASNDYSLHTNTKDLATPHYYIIAPNGDGILFANSTVWEAGSTYPNSKHFSNVQVSPYDYALGKGYYHKTVSDADYELTVSWTNTSEKIAAFIGFYLWNPEEGNRIPLFAFFGGRG